jgi:hypothetical protein
MRSITTWSRIEPEIAGPDPAPALQARVFDPAWLLGRQWQLGELGGEDAASPAWVRLRVASAPLTRARPGDAEDTVPLPPGAPLEPFVEAEGGSPVPDWRDAAEAGAHFLSVLTASGLERLAPDFVDEYPLPDPATVPDRAGRAWLRLFRRRSFDGAALRRAAHEAAEGTGDAVALPARPRAGTSGPALLEALRRWLAWYPEPPGAGAAWQPERLEYRFQAAAPAPDGTELVLEAPDYQGGRLDWPAFRAVPDVALGAADDAEPERIVRTALPAPVTYPGMPANRWWEFEDARVWFGGVETEAGDLARMLLVGFATVYGNDWFLAPVELEPGAVARVEALVVVDTFGQATLVEPTELARPGPAPDRRWRMFHVDGVAPGTLVVPSVSAGGLEGRPVEEVVLLRDETANMAFAVERKVTGPAGNPIDRHERWRARLAEEQLAAAPDGGGEPGAAAERDLPSYRLANDVPDHWIPLVPVATGRRSIRLERGTVVTGDGRTFPPEGRLLEPERPLAFPEEELPRSGLAVTRSWQLARDASGATHAWVGRRTRPGRGEGSSGLAFDELAPPS